MNSMICWVVLRRRTRLALPTGTLTLLHSTDDHRKEIDDDICYSDNSYDGLRAMRRPKQAVDTDSELVNVNGVQPGEGGGRQRKSKMDNAMRRQSQHKARSNKKRS